MTQRVRTILPGPRGLRFEGRLVAEGRAEKGGLRVNLPAAAVRGGALVNWPLEGWHEISLGETTFYAVLRRSPIGQHAFPVPKWLRGRRAAGDIVSVAVRPVVRHKARPTTESGLDWFAFVDPAHLPITRGEALEIWTRHEPPFRLRRILPWSAFWLLGFYQAEGSKSATATDFSVANRSPELLRRVATAMRAWGIDEERIYLEVLHARGQEPAAARAIYASVEARVAAIRARSGVGYEAGVLHAASSTPLLRCTKTALTAIVEGRLLDELPREAAMGFALGFLDGDGTITLDRSTVVLRLAGAESELRCAQRALERAFGWRLNNRNWWNASRGISWTLRADRTAALARAGAFAGSTSRVRLLLGLDRQTMNLRALPETPFRYVPHGVPPTSLSGLQMHGHARRLPDGYYEITERGRHVRELYSELAAEIALALARGLGPKTKGGGPLG